jgi:phage shock protein E
MKFISRLIYLIVLFAVIGGIVYYLYSYTAGSPFVVSSEVANILLRTNKIDVVLDVRTKMERENIGYYPGSTNIPVNDIRQQYPKNYPNKSNIILVYCNTGQRSRYATDLLHSMGYNNAIYITGSPGTLTKKTQQM